jgi:transposase-like protein
MERSVEQVINEILTFPITKRKAILDRLNKLLKADVKEEATLIEVRKDLQQQTPISCPHCKSESIVGYGKYRDIKRYKCKSCGKTFNDLTGTSASYIHKKSEWKQYMSCISEGLTLREAAEQTGISYRTSFLWRHKILGAFHYVGCTKLEGIVEGDETFFLYSEKGQKTIEGRDARKRGGKASKAGINDEHVAVIVASDRDKHAVVEVAGRSRITAEKINSAIGKWIPEDAVALCSDSHRSYEKFAKDRDIRHIAINASKGQHVKDKVYHIQNVNQIHHSLKDWISRFNGVASKYLQNYMNWYRIQRVEKGNVQKYLELALESNSTYVPGNKISTHYSIS